MFNLITILIFKHFKSSSFKVTSSEKLTIFKRITLAQFRFREHPPLFKNVLVGSLKILRIWKGVGLLQQLHKLKCQLTKTLPHQLV